MNTVYALCLEQSENAHTSDCRCLEGDSVYLHTCISKGLRNFIKVSRVIQDITQHPIKLSVDKLDLSFIVWIAVLRHVLCNNTSWPTVEK